MAIYHLHVGTVSRKTGRSSVAAAAYHAAVKLHNEHDDLTHYYSEKANAVNAAAYRSGELLHNEQGGLIHDYTYKRGVAYSEIMLPDNAPHEYQDRATLWNAVEKSEKRCNARTARDIDVALPIEFDSKEQIQLMQKFVKENFVEYGMIADFAIHDKGDGNPHAHVLLTTRNVDIKGFTNKNRDWDKPEYLMKWRENWADVCNNKLQSKGLDERIDHRTLEAQGIDREPTIHIGIKDKILEKKGIITAKVRQNREIIERNREKSTENTAEYIHELKQGYTILDKEIAALKTETANAERDTRIMKNQAEKIADRAEYIQDLRNRTDELTAERQNMGVFASKKAIDVQIKQLEQSREQAERTFNREYDIPPEQSENKIKQLEDRARSLQNLQDKLREKLMPLVVEKDAFEFEYQRQILRVEVSPDRQAIHDKVAQLDKETHSRQSPKEKMDYLRSERALDTSTERVIGSLLRSIDAANRQDGNMAEMELERER